MSFGQKGRELLQELQRSDWLPPYNDDGVREVLQECGAAWDELYVELFAEGRRSPQDLPDAARAAAVCLAARLRRGKRALLLYHQARAAKVRRLRWEAGPAVPAPLAPLLGGGEAALAAGYDRLLTAYFRAAGLDLAADPGPPRELHAEVRALGDHGAVALEHGGEVRLERGATHLLRREDADALVRRGLAEQL
ncbi:unnamed protein product [Heterosigma akashiwo]